jgi:hypothetical protein
LPPLGFFLGWRIAVSAMLGCELLDLGLYSLGFDLDSSRSAPPLALEFHIRGQRQSLYWRALNSIVDQI